MHLNNWFKNRLIIISISIFLVFTGNSIVLAGAGEPGIGDEGDEKYSGPAVLIDIVICY